MFVFSLRLEAFSTTYLSNTHFLITQVARGQICWHWDLLLIGDHSSIFYQRKPRIPNYRIWKASNFKYYETPHTPLQQKSYQVINIIHEIENVTVKAKWFELKQLQDTESTK